MEELLRAAGRSVTLRRATQRWVEYAIVMWIVALAVLTLDRWQGWNLTTVVVSLILLGVAFAGVAILHNLRFLESTRRERVLVETAAGRGHCDDLTAFVVPGAAPGGIVDVVAGGVLGDAVLGVPA